MAEDWASVAAEVAVAIGEVGFSATLRKRASGPAAPWDAAATAYTDAPIAVVEDRRRNRDNAGNLLSQSLRTIMVAATGAAPAKADRIMIGGTWHEIAEVRPVSPGGVDLLYDCDISESV